MSLTYLYVLNLQIISHIIFIVQHFADILMEEPKIGEFFSLIDVKFVHLGDILLYCLEICIEALFIFGIDLVLMEERLLLCNELRVFFLKKLIIFVFFLQFALVIRVFR